MTGKMSAFRALKSPAAQAFSSAIFLWTIHSSSKAENGVLNADFSLQTAMVLSTQDSCEGSD